MKKSVTIKNILLLLILVQSCKEKAPQPPGMISVPQFEFISKSTVNNSTKNTNISLDAFYISNEITNKEYREFTDWAKNHPDEILSKPKDIIVQKNSEPGKTKVWTVPIMVTMSDLLSTLIDSNAMFKIDEKFKNYFTDEKFNDYPVVGVSKNAAEYYCIWLTKLEGGTIVLNKGQILPNGMKVKNKTVIAKGPSYGFYRIPIDLEWEYVAKQPYRRTLVNDHKLQNVNVGNPNRWGILHLHDNVSEWVTVPKDTLAVSHGDNWIDNEKPNYIHLNPDSSRAYIGFRIARTYTPEEINKKSEK